MKYMANGKAISRALRGHFLTVSALTRKLLEDCANKPVDYGVID